MECVCKDFLSNMFFGIPVDRFFSQIRVDTTSGRGAMTQPDLDQPQVDAGFQQMRDPGMPKRMHRRF